MIHLYREVRISTIYYPSLLIFVVCPYYLRQGGCVFCAICLFVSRTTEKTTGLIFIKLCGRVKHESRRNQLNFGVDLNDGLDTLIIFYFF